MGRVNGFQIPSPRRETTWIERVRPGDKFEGIILSPVLWGLLSHWNGKHSMKCTEHPATCAGCINEMPLRGKWFLHVYDVKRKECVFLELTGRAARQLEVAIPTPNEFRGYAIEVQRSGLAVNGRLNLRVKSPERTSSQLPKAEDPRAACEHLWAR